MGRPRVAMIFTGGTISMRADAGGANVPALSGTELLERVPGLDATAEIVPIEWGLVPASHLSFDQVLDIGRLLIDWLSRGDVDGAVVIQGTDVMEETAFAWDLLPLRAKPVIVVGAMRSATQDGYDGPDNLRAAVLAATDARLADQGVLVAMAGELHAADDVRKTHTHAYATFQSPNTGRLGSVQDGRVTLLRRRAQRVRLPHVPEHAATPVPLVTVALDDDGAIAAAVDRRPRGLVIAATGGGNTPPAYLEAARRLLADEVPVALTSRCPSGLPLPGYGFAGGSSSWWEAGAIFSGTLGGTKTRVLLALGIGAGLSREELGSLCEPFGGGVA